MSNVNRRQITVTSSSSVKRAATSADAGKAMTTAGLQQAKKRVVLGNITNQASVARNPSRSVGAKPYNKANSVSSTRSAKKPATSGICNRISHKKPVISETVAKHPNFTSAKKTSNAINDGPTTSIGAFLAPCRSTISPKHSRGSVSSDESMSTCNSMKSPDFEYIDNADSSLVASLERRATNNLRISEDADTAGYRLKRDVLMTAEPTDNIINVDNDTDDPQLCAAFAWDIYKHLRIVEAKKMPSTDFMERIQKDINASMRAILIDWLVEVAEEYRLVPDTLYLTVNYIDRYLSGNEMNRQKLQLLGVACMLIAAKYEEICAPQVEEFCYITDNTYFKDEVLEMEAAVLKFLKFEMTAPTAKCFLRRFVRAAQGSDEVAPVQLEFLACYIAELSLVEYGFLRYSPSMVAASSIFLAKFILQPSKRPWNATLCHYTLYKPSELSECVKSLHRLFCNSPSSSLPAIREKYSQHKYKFVAKKYCPSTLPMEYFCDQSY